MSRKRSLALVGSAVVAAAVPMAMAQTGSPALPQGSEPVTLNPADFTTNIDNPYWPMAPGSRWVLRETTPDGTKEKVVITVLNQTKKIANGVTARVVRDVVSEDGVPVEVTDDWYAQDTTGNIWYLGEKTTEYTNGRPSSTHGSFEAGVNGAQAGIALPANPQPGLTYRQEYLAGQAQDRAEVIGIEKHVQTPAGHFRDLLTTRDLNDLKPRFVEFKFYAGSPGPTRARSSSAIGREHRGSSPGLDAGATASVVSISRNAIRRMGEDGALTAPSKPLREEPRCDSW
jgi:hypothetical protein